MQNPANPLSIASGKPTENIPERQFMWFAFFNLLLVSLVGLFLRSLPFVSIPVNYKYLLHAHSHFAFGGWLMPVLTYLILHYFAFLKQKIAFKHWRNIFIILLFSAYGMLFTFPVQGYAAGSIIFSTISIGAGVYLSICVFKGLKGEKSSSYSRKLLLSGTVYLLLSSLAPFATGPIATFAGRGSALFNDAIYFFLHFQYNGFFSFVVLAVLYSMLERPGYDNHGKAVYSLFNLACVPTYFLSVLWHHPGMIFNLIGGVGAALQLVAVVFVVRDFMKLKSLPPLVKQLMQLALLALIIKVILQVASAIPVVADIAYLHRNFVIAYLHLVLLGFISLFAMAAVCHSKPALINKLTTTGMIGFTVSLVTTNTSLVFEAVGECGNYYISHFQNWLWIFTLIFPVSIALILVGISPPKQKLVTAQNESALA